jgi:hypothetical protein
MVLWSTEPLTETSTRNLPGGKGWPVCKVNKLTQQPVSQLSRKCGSLNVPQPCTPPWPVTGILLLKVVGKHKVSYGLSSNLQTTD